MNISFSVHINGMGAIPDRILDRVSEVGEAVAKRVKDDTEPFVPAGVMQEDGHMPLYLRSRVEDNLIIYPGPYARFLYFGKLMIDPVTGSSWARRGTKKVLTNKDLVFTKAIHPQAQSHWFEASKSLNLPKWIKYAQEVMDGNKK